MHDACYRSCDSRPPLLASRPPGSSVDIRVSCGLLCETHHVTTCRLLRIPSSLILMARACTGRGRREKSAGEEQDSVNV